MSQRYIGNYSDYVSNLGSKRCCSVSPKEVPIVGPTGPQGPQGFIGNASTGPTGPPGTILAINNRVIELTDSSSNPGCFILNASDYLINSWSINTSLNTINLSFQNFIINGIYRIYLTNNINIISISSCCVTLYKNSTSELLPGNYIIDINYTGSNTYYLTITGPYA